MNSGGDIFSNEWCDLIFEGKNHEYGAYCHRQNSIRRHFQALMIATVIFLIGATAPMLLRRIFPQSADRDQHTRIFSNLVLEKPRTDDVLKYIPPPPRVVTRNTIEFKPPVIKPDELVDESEEPKMQIEVINSKAAIGKVDYSDGTYDPTAPIANIEENAKIAGDPDEVQIRVDQMPQFPGGENEMFTFIKDHLRYPVIAQELGVTGTVIISFVVDRDGDITNMVVTRSIGSGCDEEAMRVLDIMPLWSPGKQAGKTVRVRYSLPFKFIIQKH
jgi:periplasmic protein TonB